MSSKLNILFTSVGRRVCLIKSFKEAFKTLRIDGKIMAADASENSAASYIADAYLKISKVNDINYIEDLLSICKKNNIKIIIPLIDTELCVLARNRKRFEDIGISLLLSSYEDIKICSDKRLTYKFLLKNNFDVPKILSKNDIVEKKFSFPLFIKPADGSSSINAFKVNNSEELKFFSGYVSNAILQEFIEGDEYTVDVLVDFSGKVCCVVPRLRMETRAGEISKGITVKNLFLINEVKKLVEKMYKALGCITVQCFLTKDNKIKFIEINPRFGGGFPLSYAAGANFPLWILSMYLKKQIDIKMNDWNDGFKMLRYDDAVFLNKGEVV
ncbi:MAG: ATP-grasp domain-containing protein [Rickettsiales bacterium]|nr:ATP-grasp domain-containing protein [Rickettsiales bacterium]